MVTARKPTAARKPITPEQAEAARVEAVRKFYAGVGRDLGQLAWSHIKAGMDQWKPADLMRLAELARELELAAASGTEAQMVAAGREAAVATGAPPDEWDQLARDLNATIPDPRRK